MFCSMTFLESPLAALYDCSESVGQTAQDTMKSGSTTCTEAE